MEVYERRLKTSGKRKADILFIIDVFLLLRPGIIKPTEGYNNLNNYSMLKSYFKVGIRNILKYKVFSFINVFGLALAMSVCMLIMLMIADQKGYDQFHLKKERIFRILSDDQNSPFPYASTPVPLASKLKSDYPIIEESTHLIKGIGGDGTYRETTVEMRGFFADSSFFKVFDFALEKGNSRYALSSSNSMVITSALARKLFKDENPIGNSIEFTDRGLHYLGGYRNEPPPVHWGSFIITGVIADTDNKSHLRFDALVSSSSMDLLMQEKKIKDLSDNWQNFYECFTYVVLTPGTIVEDLTNSLHNLVKLQYSEFESFKNFRLQGQKLTKITPGRFTANPTSFSMPIVGYYLLSFLAIIILVSACLNYINLSIARALTRVKEIGVRQTSGASRKALIFQFLSESILNAILAVSLAALLLLFIVPAFQGLWINQFLHFDLEGNLSMYFIFIGFAVLIGSIAGLFPALHLSRYKPIKALKNSGGMQTGKLAFRKVLSVSQFVISFIFITSSLLIYNQLRHFLEFDYGLNSRNIVNINLHGNDYQKVSNELASIPGVASISGCDILPATGISNGTRLRMGTRDDDYKYVGALRVNENFINNFELQLMAGSNLPIVSTSSDRFVLLNETAVKEFGYHHPAEIIGQVFEEEGTESSVEVIGVVKNFRFKLLVEQDEIGPLLLRNHPDINFANVKIISADLNGTISKLEEKWKHIDPIHSFQYEFFDDQLAKTHQAIFDGVSILGFIAVTAIIIACLGLLGMTTYIAERRTKEISIRKVMGAADLSIVYLLSIPFLKMLFLSICISAPLCYFVNNLWLQLLPNRVEFGFGTVFLSIVILLTLGLITIGSQTIRASKRNPVDALKTE